VPRRNRRISPTGAQPIRLLTAARRREIQRELEHFAREHLVAHADAVATAEPGELALTDSQHPVSLVRFVSAGDCPDLYAVRLAGGAASPSESTGTLA
jgi:hypothetical protein